jgi:hypothetical protein
MYPIIELHADACFGSLFSTPRAGMIDKNPSHHLSGDAIEVRATLPIDAVLPHQAHESFMHERGRLQCVVPTLAEQVGAGLSLEVLVDQRYQGFARLEVAVPPGLQQTRDRSGFFSHSSVLFEAALRVARLSVVNASGTDLICTQVVKDSLAAQRPLDLFRTGRRARTTQPAPAAPT